jgi:branched-chain amino acid transport system substrate-binding protein
MKKLFISLSIISAFVIAWGASFPAGAAELKLGYFTSLTGPIAASGEANSRGFIQAVEEYNAKGGYKGKPIELVVYDDEAKPAKATELMQRLIHRDKVFGVIGINHSGAALASVEIAQKANIPVMVTGAGAVEIVHLFDKKPNNYIFGLRMLYEMQAEKALRFMVEKRGINKIGIMYAPHGYGTSCKDSQVRAFDKMGLKPVGIESFNEPDRDMTPQLSRLRKKGAEAITYFCYPGSSTALLKSAKKIGWDVQFFGNWQFSAPTFYKIAGGSLADGIPFVQSFTVDMSPVAADFSKRVEKRWGEILFPVNTAQAFDGTNIMIKAMESAGGPQNTEKIRDFIEQTANFKGVTMSPPKPFSKTKRDSLDFLEAYTMATWEKGSIKTITK